MASGLPDRRAEGPESLLDRNECCTLRGREIRFAGWLDRRSVRVILVGRKCLTLSDVLSHRFLLKPNLHLMPALSLKSNLGGHWAAKQKRYRRDNLARRDGEKSEGRPAEPTTLEKWT